MIEINLLPEELKQKRIQSSQHPEHLFYFIPLIVAILILVHLYLGISQFTLSLRAQLLQSKSQNLEPQRKKIAMLKGMDEASTPEGKLIQELVRQGIRWSRYLNKLSLNLASGIWFNEISLSAKTLNIKATVVSLEHNEMDLINRFMSDLKSDAGFIRDFNNLDLGSVQKRNIGSFEVADFSLSGSLK